MIEPLVTVKELVATVPQTKGFVPSLGVPKAAGKEVISNEVAAPVELSFNPSIIPSTVPATFPVTLVKEKVKSRALAVSGAVKQTRAAATSHFCQ